jgi:hypothetical protein
MVIPIIIILVAVICIGAVVIFVGNPTPAVHVDIPEDMEAYTADFQNTVSANIASIMENSGISATLIANVSTTEQERILRTLHEEYPLAVSACYIDLHGVSQAVIPKFSAGDLTNIIREQDLTESSFANENLLILGPFASRTYGEILLFLTPVYNADGAYTGYICLVGHPGILLPENSATDYKDTDYNPMIVDVDGTVVYYPDSEFIGRNILTDELFEKSGVVNAFSTNLKKESGNTTYVFYDVNYGPLVNNAAMWSTVTAGGRTFRTVLSYDDYFSPTIRTNATTDLGELISTVENMLVYAKKQGKDRVLAEINNPNGQFHNENVTIFAYNMDGTVLAYPDMQVMIGEDRINYRDAYGIRTVDNLITRCLQGGGYVHAYITASSETIPNAAVLELYYVLPVDDEWFVGARVEIAAESMYAIDSNKQTSLFRDVQTAQQYILNNGREKALKVFSHPGDGFSVSNNSNIFAMSYNGTFLANSASPEKVGTDYLFYTDRHGGSTVREMIILAKQGGGYTYLEQSSTLQPNITTISLVYLEPVDDEWFVGSYTELNTVTEQATRN